MKLANKIFSIVLVILLIATVYGLIRTGRESSLPGGNGAAVASGAEQAVLVDQTPLLTTQAFARMPTSAVELPFAQEALQLGDQEMDLAFALAVLDVTQHPPVLTPEAKQIQARVLKAEDALAAEQAQVTQLTTAEVKAIGAQKDTLDSQLDLAKAQLELRQDEVDDAKEDLSRAGGDSQDRVQAMVQEHEAASQASDATKVNVSAPIEPRGLIHRFQQWSALHQKQLQLWSARQEALSAGAALAAQHNSLSRQIEPQNQKSTGPAAPATAASTSTAGEESNNPSKEESAAILKTTKRRAADEKTLSTLDKRIENEKQLANVYGQWIAVVAAEQRSIVNLALRGVLIILVIAILALFLDDWIGSLLAKLSMDRHQVETLRTATGVTLQVAGVLLALLVLFGSPSQLGAMVGLATAGLTIALKDFPVAFVGRFVLMGKNGIRVGDWVEINGVTGEVVELSMFHTVLLETGNWTASGHPTGRRVTFMNTYAVEGHYFNFSTSGQWLWDELTLVLPTGQNLHPVVDAIHKSVLEATSERARQAEREWHGAIKSRDLKALSAEPAINVKSVSGGTEISVRYITSANERARLREQLNHALVDLLGSGLAPQPQSDSPKPALTAN